MPINLAFTSYDVERTHKAIAYLQNHYTENTSADQLAGEVMIDKRKLQTVLKILTGLTVHSFIIKTRIEKATEDLANRAELTVNQIASRHGFRNASKFIKHFRKRMGQTPKEYRQHLLITGNPL
jgi:AraC-like DNA-binding protein